MDFNRKSKDFIFLIYGFLLTLNILAWIAAYDLSQPRFLEVTFFDVGQGDAIFIETPQSHQILIDGGPDSTILEKLAKEMPFWDRTIDLIILTHPEKDHLAGLLDVLKRYKIENIFWTGVVRDTPEFREWQNLIKQEGAKIKISQAGQKINVTRTVLDLLHPLENLKGKEMEDSNNTSIVARLNFGKNSFLFTGDIYKSAEEELIREYSCSNSCKFGNLDSDILKVSHHGSKTSSSEEFIKEVSPEVAIILVGKDNRYGHPHQETLEILAKYAIKILRTNLNGDIKITSDGINLLIK